MLYIKNFKTYTPSSKPFGDGAVYLISDSGIDWYQMQSQFSRDTLKVVFDKTGLIVSCSRDVSALCPTDCGVLELESERDDLMGLYVVNGAVVYEPKPSQYHEYVNGEWAIPHEKQAALLQQQREQVFERINALKVEKTKGGVLLNGHWFDTDGEAQINVMGAYNGMLLAGLKSRQWTTYDNQTVTLTLDEMKALYLAVLNVKDHNHKTSIMHKKAAAESDDPIHYDYSTGWSETYEESTRA